MKELNCDLYYTENEEENKFIGTCGCGSEIYESDSYIEIEDEVYCDSLCVYEYLVKSAFNVKEN